MRSAPLRWLGGALAVALLPFLVAAPAQAAREIRLVNAGDTPGASYLDATVAVGETAVLELWIESDTRVNGVSGYLLYQGQGVRLREFSDATDSFPIGSAGIQADEDHATFGDVLRNVGNWTGSATDTFQFAAVTNADSVQGSYRVARLAFTGETIGTWAVTYVFSPGTNEITALTASESNGTDVLLTNDSGVIRVIIADTPILGQILFASDTAARFWEDAPFDTAVGGDTVWFAGETQTLTLTVLFASLNKDSATFSAGFDSGTQSDTTDSYQAVFHIGASEAVADTLVTVHVYDASARVDSTQIRFKPDTAAPDSVTLDTPALGALASANPTLQWNLSTDTAGSGVGLYKVQLDTQGTFANVLATDSTAHPDSNLVLSTTLADGTYFWRVLAFDRVGNVVQTGLDVDSFVVDAGLPTSPVLQAPADQAETRARNIRFEWTAGADTGSGMQSHTLQISRDSTFVSVDTQMILGAADTNATSGDSLFGTDTWYWRVVARDVAGNTAASATRRFLLDTTPPVAAVLAVPAVGHETNVATVNFSWTAATDTHAGLANQRLQIDTSGAFAAGTLVEDSVVTATTTSGSRSLVQDTYFWRILALDDAGNTSAPTGRLLVVDTAAPSAAGPATPSAGHETNVRTIVFFWTASTDSLSGVNGYRLQADTEGGNFASPIADSSTTALSETLVLPSNDTYQWRVVARDDAGNTTASAARVFVIDTGAPSAAGLASPAAGHETSVRTIVFFWTAATDSLSGVNGYRLQADTAGGNFASPIADSSTTALSETLVLPANDTYLWRVVAADDAGNTTPSASRVLVVDTTAPVAATLLAPLTLTETNAVPLLFRWTPATDLLSGLADQRIQIDTDGTFTPASLRYDSSVGLAANTTIAVPEIASFLFWRIVAQDDAGNTTPAASQTFVVDTTNPTVPALNAPADLHETNAASVGFDWDAASDTGSGINRYRIRIDTDAVPTGAMTVDSFQVAPDTSIALADGVYYWQIAAVDDATNSSVFTTPRRLVVDRTAPVLLTLTVDSSVPGFFWDGGGIDATATEDTVYFNNTLAGLNQTDTLTATMSGGESISFPARFGDGPFDDQSSPFLFAYTIEGAAGNTATLIVALDTAGNQDSIVLNWVLDATNPTPASLVNPSDSATTGDTTPSLSWSASSDTGTGVRGYHVQIAGDSAFNVVVESSFVATTAFTSAGLADSTYYWRAVAYDSVANADTAGAQIRSFRVDSGVPFVASISVVSSAPLFFWEAAPVTPGMVADTVFFNPVGAGAGQTDTLTILVGDANETRVDGTAAFTVIQNSDSGLNLDTYTLVYLLAADAPTTNIQIVVTDVTGFSDTVNVLFEADTNLPSAPALAFPAAAHETASATIVFTWAAATDTGAGIREYRLQIDTAAGNFASPLIDSSTGTSLTGTITAAANDTFLWRVVAVDNVSNTQASAPRLILHDSVPPTAPAPSSPADATETNRVSVIFSWSASTETGSGLAAYRLQASTDSTFAAILADSSTTALSETLVLAANDTYYWRVVAADDAGNTAVGATRVILFDTTPPTAAALGAPADNHETSVATVTFTWTPAADTIAGLADQRLQISTDSVFTTIVLDSSAGPLAAGGAATLTADTFYWRVLAVDEAANTTASAGRRIFVDTTAPTAAIGLVPASNHETNTVTFAFGWTPATDLGSGLADQRLQVSADSTFATTIKDSSVGLASTGVCTSFAQDTLYWRILAQDDAGNTSASAPLRFVVDTAPPTTLAELFPAALHETTTAVVGFVWTAAADLLSGVREQRIQVDTEANFAGGFVADSQAASATAASGTVALTGSETYYWRIFAQDDAGNTAATAGRVLIIDTTAPQGFSLVDPTAGETAFSPVLLDWSPSSDSHAGLANYRLQVDTTPTFPAPFVDGFQTSPDSTITLSADTWYWRVWAIDDVGNSVAVSDSFRVVVAAETQAPDSFSLLVPSDLHETSATTIQFRWSDSSDSSPPISYRLIVDTDMAGGFVVDTTVSETFATVFVPGSDTYLWRVIATDASANTRQVGDSRVIVDTRAPESFAFVDPTAGETKVSPVLLDWTASSDSHSGLLRYRLQVDTTPTFPAPFVDGFQTSPDSTLALASDTWYWRVYAIDDVGNSVAVSDSFLVFTPSETQAPDSFSLLVPTDLHETSATTIQFRWSQSSDSSLPLTYRLIVDTDMAGGFVVDTTVSETFATVFVPGSDTYLWRVIATDASANTRQVGDSRVIVDTRAPESFTLVDPTAGETKVSPVLLDWNASSDSHSGLLRYRLQVDTSATFPAPFVDGFQTAPDSTLALASDTWYWRVYAIDDVGNSVAVSDSFLVFTPSETQAPDSFTLLVPTDLHETTVATFQFRWSDATDSTPPVVYRLIVDTDLLGAAYPIDTTVSETFATVTLPTNDTWLWRVIATDANANTRVVGDSRVLFDTTGPSTPSLVSPVNSAAVTTVVALDWNASADSVSGFRRYRIQVDTAGTFTGALHADSYQSTSDTTLVLTTVDTYWWRIVAEDDLGNTTAATADSFRVTVAAETQPPSTFSLLTPSDLHETSATTIQFRWGSSTDSTPPISYRLIVDTDLLGAAYPIDTTVADSFATVTLAASDTYLWRVIATDALGNTRQVGDFRVIVDTQAPNAAVLTTLAGTSVLSPAALAWTPATDAHAGLASQRLQIDTVSTFPAPYVDVVLSAVASSTSVLLPTAGTYYWRVIGQDDVGNTAAAATDSFVVTGNETTPPAVSQSPVVSPSTASNAAGGSVVFTIAVTDSSGIASVTLNLAGFSVNYSAVTPLGDTGSGGDTAAGDSIYAATVNIDSTVLGGGYNLVFTITDLAGNTTTVTVPFVVTDPTPPTAPLLSPDPSLEVPSGVVTVWGDELTLFADYSTDYDRVVFQYRASPSGTWTDIGVDTDAVRWALTWNVAALAPDTYDARAIGVVNGETDLTPTFVRVKVENSADSLIHEYADPVTDEHILRRRITKDTLTVAMVWDGTQLVVPVGAVALDTLYVRITSRAAAPAAVPSNLREVFVHRRFVREDGLSFFDEDVTVVLPYNDDDDDGKEDSTGIEETKLAVYFYNTATGVWQRIPNSVVNTETNTVQATVQHFTDFAIFGAAPSSNLSAAIVVPNPWVPNDGSADNGVAWTAGDDNSGVQFRNVTDVVTIEVYNIAGRKVATINASGTRGNVRWNAQSDDNRDVASGVYIAILRAPSGEVVTRRFVIVR